MQFIDTVTPSTAQQYVDNARNIQGVIGDHKRQLTSDWATMYYQNAYNTALLNYQNQYNSPLQQMLRYQEAGVNPMLVAGNMDAGNISSTHAGAAPKGSFVAPSSLDAITKTMSSINDTVQSASQLYDYLKYGRSEHAQEVMNEKLKADSLGAQIRRYNAEADWAEYWNYPSTGSKWSDSEGNFVVAPSAGSPRAEYMETSVNYKAEQIEQVKALVNTIYPNQAEAQKAMASLNAYKESVMHGQYGAILQIDTGNKTADNILQLILLKVLSTNFGISGKMF